MKYLLITLAVALCSCGPAYHLKKAKQHLKKAEQKGAQVKVDTVFKTVEVVTEKIEVDTLVKYRDFRDTIRIETPERVKLQIKVDTLMRTIYAAVECPPDTVRVEVGIPCVTEIKAGFTWWEVVIFMLFAGLAVWVFTKLFGR